jgi:porin
MKRCSPLALLVATLILNLGEANGACLQHTGAAPSPETPDPGPPPFDYQHNLLGDWFGARNWLLDHGIDVTASYTAEPAGNPVGGEKQSFTYLHNIGVGISMDLEKLAGIPDTTFLVTMSQRSGSGLTQEAVKNAISVQQIFGGGQTIRLVQMRFDHNLFDGRFSFAYGRLTTTSDFLASDLYCQFVTNGICGQPSSPFFNMNNGITAYPAASWGTLARVETSEHTYVKAGVYDGDVTSGYDLHGTNFGFGDNGVLIMTEAGYKSDSCLGGMPGRYSLGAFYHTGHFSDVSRDTLGTNLLATGLPAEQHWGQEGFYLLFEQMLLRNHCDPATGLESFVTFVAQPDEEKSTMPYYLNGGLIYQGLVPGRPSDKTSLGFYTAWWSRNLREAEHEAGLSAQSCETLIELNHQFQLNSFFYLRPDIQYVIKPNGQTSIHDALVLGMEVGVVF